MSASFRRLQARFFLFVACLFLFGCSAELQEGLTERQANRILTLLKGKGIAAQKSKDPGAKPPYNWKIAGVAQADIPKAIRLLHANNLPAKKVKGFADIYGGGGMKIPTKTEERAKYQMALSGELVNTLKRIQGVIDARVHLVIPEEKILQRPGQVQAKPSASVLIMHRANTRILITIQQIKTLIAGSLESLDASRVNVVIVRQKMSQAAAGGDSADDSSSPTTGILGGFVSVAKGDAMTLKIILIVLALLLVVFISLFIWQFMRASSMKNQIDAVGVNGNGTV